MRKIVLFSNEDHRILDKIFEELFPKTIKDKVFSYIPSDGADKVKNTRYTPVWRDRAVANGVKQFHYIDNSKSESSSLDEYYNIMSSNIVFLTGGNTYIFLRNMKRSRLDDAIVQFSKKDEFILAGCSSGAMILTPTIDLCVMEGFAENKVGLKDTTGFGVVDFEVCPHYDSREKAYKRYVKTANNEVKTINEDGMIILNV